MLALSSRLQTMIPCLLEVTTCLVFSPWCLFLIFIWVNDSAI
jgi:hypothetical protein